LTKIEQVCNLFGKVLIDLRSTAITNCVISEADIDFEAEQVEKRIDRYKEQLAAIFEDD
jgi:hypothetical protein